MPLLGVDAIGCILNLDIAVENSSSKYYLKKEGVLCTLLTRHKTIFKEHLPSKQGFVAERLKGGRRPSAEPHFI